MSEPRQQKRARRIAMSEAERDQFLAAERTCRLATIGSLGPHVAPVWFVWHDGSIWIHSLCKSQRWTDLQRDPRAAVVIDAGTEYNELRGVELRGKVQVVGEVPRTGDPEPRLDPVERAFAEKYAGSSDLHYDHKHAWLELVPEKIVSWDFRKL